MALAKKETILVVDDESGIRQSFNMILKDDYNLILAENGLQAIDKFKKNAVDLVLLDILLPDTGGLELLKEMKSIDSSVEIIMVTAVKEVSIAVKAIKLGAYEYIMKPFNVDDILSIIARSLEKRALLMEVTYLKTELERCRPFEKMVGKDPKMMKIFELIAIIAQSDGTVLIQGESGTGKELVARAIHKRSQRSKDPFVVSNCAAIPATLMESEMFGYCRGAFTGAVNTRIGKLELGNKGTIFLDDIDTLDISMQAKLLRIIQEKELERLGSSKVIKLDIRFIAASNKDLEVMIEEGGFREDLYYRLKVFPIMIPPLRERRGDIPLLLDHFTTRFSKQTGLPEKKFSQGAVNTLVNYDWPGNIREFQNLMERLFTITPGPVIRKNDIPTSGPRRREFKGKTLKEAVNSFEKQYISDILETVDGNKKKAAEKLGIHRNTLLAKTNP